jgi:hypothetical protein
VTALRTEKLGFALVIVLSSAAALACGGGETATTATTATTSGGETTATTGVSVSSTSATGSTGSTGTTTTTGSIGSTTDDSAGSETGCSFLGCSDEPSTCVAPPGLDGVVRSECDVWTQDCPEGHKCVPWANDGGGSWNATRCVPLDPNPKQPGDACVAPEGGVSGVDDCDINGMCWDVDPETDEGLCVAFCEGSADDPMCAPGSTCTITNDGVLSLCLPSCDPLLQDCPGDDLCLPVNGEFACVLDASGEMGAYGDPCEYATACDPGLVCLNPEYVPDCMAGGCCSPFCDVTAPNMCPGGGQECVAWYEEGMAPPGLEDVGVCGIPQ